MTSKELIYITLEMLDAHAVIGSIVPTLEKAPEQIAEAQRRSREWRPKGKNE